MDQGEKPTAVTSIATHLPRLTVPVLILAAVLLAAAVYCRSADAGPAEPPVVKTSLARYLLRNVFRVSLSRKPRGRRPPTQLDALANMMNRTGWNTFQYRFLGTRTVMTRDPANIKAILSTQFREFGMGARKDNFRSVIGKGIFAADGEEWSRLRALFRPAFARDDAWCPGLEKHVQTMVDSLSLATKDGEPAVVDLQEPFFRLALDVSADMLFGLDLSGSAARGKEVDVMQFSRNFDSVQDALGVRCRLGRAYWLYDGLSLRKKAAAVHGFAEKILSEGTRSSPRGQQFPREAPPTLADRLLQTMPDGAGAHSQLLHMLIASRDTVAVTLGWLFLHLSRRPDLYGSLRSCIAATFGADSPPRRSQCTAAALAACAPLQNVIMETLRLHPPIPINTRTALVATTLPRGGGRDGASPIAVRAGAEVTYSVYALQRDPGVWGPDADDFRPGRWDERERKFGCDFAAFSAGPRTCMGQRLAMYEIGHTVVRMVQRFGGMDGIGDEDEAMEAKVTLTNSPARGVWVRMRE